MTQGNKRLIVCCDGTWNEPDKKLDNNPADETQPTNVLKVVCGIAPVDRHKIPQVVYYDSGNRPASRGRGPRGDYVSSVTDSTSRTISACRETWSFW